MWAGEKGRLWVPQAECQAPSFPSCSSVFGNARPEGPGMDVRKTLGNNVLLRFGTRLRALQNVIKILLMGQRGVETHGRKAARSWRAHMGAGRPCVQRGKGRRQPGRVSICPSAPIPPSLSNLLISILTHWLYTFASLLSPRCPALRMPKCCLHCSACCQVGWDAGRDVLHGKVQQNSLQQQGHGSGWRWWLVQQWHWGLTA